MVKILHLQYGCSAASPANRLHKAFLEKGIASQILALHLDRNHNIGIHIMDKGARLISKADGYVQSYLKKNLISEFGGFSYPVIGSNISSRDEVQEADVIYVHWVLNGFLSIKNMEQIASLGKPLIFVMHDMWTITGGCHHSFECNKYLDICKNCQFFEGSKIKDLAYKGFKKKQNFFSAYSNLYFVSPSDWLYNCAVKSVLLNDKSIFHIANVLDSKLFKPIDKKVAKNILNLDVSKKVIVFGAMEINSPYKGWKYLKSALDILFKSGGIDFQILVFGTGPNSEISEAIPYETKFVGYIDSEYTMSVIYNAADVFVAPSLADNLPYTILESLFCGTPVVAFNVGGIPELIDHTLNGYLANYKNSGDLAEGIKFCIDHKIKGYRLNQYEENLIIDQHLNLINKVMLNPV